MICVLIASKRCACRKIFNYWNIAELTKSRIHDVSSCPLPSEGNKIWLFIRITIFKLASCFPTPWQNHEYVNGLFKNPQEYKNIFSLCASNILQRFGLIHIRHRLSKYMPDSRPVRMPPKQISNDVVHLWFNHKVKYPSLNDS